jgi:hypothetical protein
VKKERRDAGRLEQGCGTRDLSGRDDPTVRDDERATE